MTPPFKHIDTEAEVALALCNLGIDRRSPALIDGENGNPPASPSLDRLADVACSSLPYLRQSSSNPASPPVPYVACSSTHHMPPSPPMNTQPTSNLVSSSHLVPRPVPHVASCSLHHLPPPPPSIPTAEPPNNRTQTKPARVSPPLAKKAPHLDISARRARKSSVKHRTGKRLSRNEDTSITFQEMQRLMNVYGPLKCFRNRSSNETGKEIKATSILRKFYRWFPDFEERFVKTSEGWYTPRIGHEKEIQYRETMRGKDEKFVVNKRNNRRYHIHMDMLDNPTNSDPFGMPKSY